ncbi:F0F1 ATP synthase subunit A [Vitiosangium sp. GDMCC 1.1324]|uniref:F0F1 ATP synthase subunit A n=1 Tax=Vitiosangium sp. (strain GDMCC 1.1324) TaxID=2138576 RepID=UPI000D3976F8|nr:F0F1 ATP synthase subunit A [Vitiosangium sp. GDMCC 1.1324]PTL84535.1 ATP synthase F0 subunit A [Vitiosangium sp. GDMCC 1.1324]
MRKAMVLLVGLMAGVAFAAAPVQDEHGSEATGGEHGAAVEHATAAGEHVEKEEENVAAYILHHVSDSPEYEIEIPLRSDHKAIHLPQFGIPIRGGASCEPRDTGHGMAVPGWSEGCLDLSITKHTVMMWLAAVLLIGSLLLFSNRDKTKLVPRGASANLFEMLVLFVRDELAIKNIGKEEGPRYTPYLLTAFFFILFMNLLGLFPWMASATGNIAVTCGLALCTFVITQVAGIRAAGFGGYLAHLTGGVHPLLWPIMIPVEVLGLFTKPFALTMRLFANMLAGHIVIFFLLGLIFMLGNPAVALVSVPFAMGIYLLELFVAFVQAYVFTMLSALFIGMSVAMGHHGHGHDEEHGHKDTGHGHDHGKAHVAG